MFAKWKEFRAGREEKKYQKALRQVKNPKAIRDDRLAALQFLVHMKSPEKATRALLQRFEYSLEHGINDTREKEMAMDGIVKHGAIVAPYVREHIQNTAKIAWPIKIMRALNDQQALLESLKGALNFQDISFNQMAVDKNYDILCYLRDFQLGDFVERVKHFMHDPDERVRFACVEVLIEQKRAEIPSILEPFLKDDSVENRRIKQAVMNAFVENGWKVTKPEVFEQGIVGDGVRVTKDGYLQSAARS